MKLNQLKNKSILILGFAKEGKDSYLALRKLRATGDWRPSKALGIADRKQNKNYLKKVKNYDLIIKSPGIPLRIVKPFLKKGAKIISQTEIFFENCPGTIIGVTGTKGKGTTACLIYQILKRKGLRVKLVGNIGKPVFQVLLKAKKEDIFVYELSSHQLQNLKKSPKIAVFLNLYPAHLDYFRNFQNYKKAKKNITLNQTKKDFFIYNSDEKFLKEIAKKTKAKKIPFGIKKLKELKKIIPRKEIPLKGDFNLLNVLASVLVAEIFDIPEKTIRAALKSFKSLAHRLEFVGKYKGIEFYNDSLATIPQSTIAALDGLGASGARVKTLILGGSENGVDFSLLAKKILKINVKTLIFLSPGTGEKIWQEIQLKKKKGDSVKSFFVSSMAEAVKKAYQTTKKGKICLLSPAAPSFNLFQDYEERGNLFKKFVKAYAKKKTS